VLIDAVFFLSFDRKMSLNRATAAWTGTPAPKGQMTAEQMNSAAGASSSWSFIIHFISETQHSIAPSLFFAQFNRKITSRHQRTPRDKNRKIVIIC
jgi:hypothetical protein